MPALPKDTSASQPSPNIALQFIQPSGKLNETLGVPYWLQGYLSDDGLKLSLTSQYTNVLDFAGTLFDTYRQLQAGYNAIVKENLGRGVTTYMQGGIMLNAPFFWQGTEPIDFTLQLYEIAKEPADIIKHYQQVLTYLSPYANANADVNGEFVENLGKFTDAATKGKFVVGGDQQTNAAIALGAAGPAYINVHFFPTVSALGGFGEDFESNMGNLQLSGRIQFLNCLCSNVTMEIKAPYDKSYSPIIGSYSFQLKTPRIVDRTQVENLFKYTEAAK